MDGTAAPEPISTPRFGGQNPVITRFESAPPEELLEQATHQ